MKQFQSLTRLLFFYILTLLIMLSLYYVTLFIELKEHSQQYTLHTFSSLQHEFIEHADPTNTEVKNILSEHFFQDISYQLIFMLPSGQTYIHRYTRPGEREFTTVAFPSFDLPFTNNGSNNNSAYTLTNSILTGTIKLESGHQIYIVLRHKPPEIDWISYRFWLPLMAAIILFIIALLYMLNRRANWQKLLLYTDNLNTTAKESYTPPPFIETKATPEFLRLGHTLSRISYQLHNNHRRIKTLNHRLERLVDQAPLPMLMIMRHGQISFFNRRFEQLFATSFQSDADYQLTDFVTGSDESTQLILQKLSTQRVTRTLLVQGVVNKQTYQLHITPWFSGHGQIHGFTVLLNSVNEFFSQIDHLQQQNQQLQQQLREFSQLRSVIGHELRSPLDDIIGTLEEIDPDNLSAKQHEVLTTLTQSSHSMMAMLSDMLDMAKKEPGNTYIINESVDLFKLGKQVSDLMTSNAQRQGLELLYFFAPDCPRYIDTDSKRLRQILINLLDNAIKFTSSGYVALIIEPINIEQRSQLQKQNQESKEDFTFTAHSLEDFKGAEDNSPHHWIRFSVQDTGIGIAPAEKKQLFSYFNQTNTVANEQLAGTGLGITTSNSFAHLLGGFIDLNSSYDNSTLNNITLNNSTSDKGSTFNLYLPCRHPNYQPVYHFNTHLTHLHLVAVVNQTLCATNLQRLCQYLSITANIFTSIDIATVQQLTDQLTQNKQALTPILLLDHEYYENSVRTLSDDSEDDNKKLISNELNHVETTYEKISNQAISNQAVPKQPAPNNDRWQALNCLLADAALPKILLSMKPERRIPSTLLDRFDSFLSKPLDSGLLLSELIRLTQPVMRPIVQKETLADDNNKPVTVLDNPINEVLAPLVLVVEDSLTNQKIACKLLSKLGYRSMLAEDGQQALHKLQAHRQEISLILMDCRMPVMDGLQATQAIRAQGDDIPIVALTANNTEKDREDCLAVGMDEFLSKPIDKNKLQAVLQRFIKA